MNESALKKHIFTLLSYHKEFFGWVETTTGSWDPKKKCFRTRLGTGMRRGVADVMGLWLGRGLALEIKTDKGRLSDAQILFLNDFRKAGGIAAVLRSLVDTELLVQALRQNPQSEIVDLPARLTPFL